MDIPFIYLLLAGTVGIFCLLALIAKSISNSRRDMPSRRFDQKPRSAQLPFMNTEIYPSQIMPLNTDMPSASISDTSGADIGATSTTPDMGSVIAAGDMGVVSGGDIGGSFGGDAGASSF